MPDTFTVGTHPVSIAVPAGKQVTLTNGHGATLYYKKTKDVSSSSNDGSLAQAASVTFTGGPPRWLVTASSSTNVFAVVNPDDQTDMATQAELDAAVSPVLSVVAFGADPTGATYSDAAFADAIAYIESLYLTNVISTSQGTRLFIPRGTYKLSAKLRLGRGCVIEGVSGWSDTGGSALLFDDGVSGFAIENNSTSVDTGSGAASTIRDLSIIAAAQTIPGADGVQIKAKAKLENVYIHGFSRDGVNIDVEEWGTNSNGWVLDTVRVELCGRNGVLTRGNDANAGYAASVDVAECGTWGINESSFLGNTYIGCEIAGCGTQSGSVVSTLNGGISSSDTTITLASSSGFDADGGVAVIEDEAIRYTFIAGNVLSGCERGYGDTDAASHSNGVSLVDYYGAYKAVGSVNKSQFISCYMEGGQTSMIDAPSMSFGPIGNDPLGSGPRFAVREGNATIYPSVVLPTGVGGDIAQGYVQLGGGSDTYKRLIEMWNPTDGGYDVQWGATRLYFRHNNVGGADPIVLTGAADTDSIPAGNLILANGFYLAGNKKVSNGASAPGSGAHSQGEIVLNTAPIAGGTIGWVCTTAGTPGTWKTFGAISA